MTFNFRPAVRENVGLLIGLAGGTGSGKTQCAGHLASYVLNNRKVDQVVLVCPNRSIRRRARQVFSEVFGIELVIFNARKHVDGIGRSKEGYILTYAHLIQNPQLHRRICSPNTIVIFDEIHHLGDKNGWGDAAVEAFGRVRHVVALTGTPYRSDNTRIPFVTYLETDAEGLVKFRPDFSYNLGQAVADGVCRKPLFRFHKATVRIRPQADAGELEVTFDDTNVTDQIASLRLRGAVQYGSPARVEMLRSALAECRAENRKVVIFLGGDSESEHTATTDATQLLPTELHELGIGEHEYEVVVGVDKEAQDKIAKFGASPKWILVSVNMVSEGTDIPELSAAIFLTSVTAKQTTVQRIGRALRFMGPTDTNPEALVFMFGDPNLLALADEIENEIEVEVNLRRKQAAPDSPEGAGDALLSLVLVLREGKQVPEPRRLPAARSHRPGDHAAARLRRRLDLRHSRLVAEHVGRQRHDNDPCGRQARPQPIASVAPRGAVEDRLPRFDREALPRQSVDEAGIIGVSNDEQVEGGCGSRGGELARVGRTQGRRDLGGTHAGEQQRHLGGVAHASAELALDVGEVVQHEGLKLTVGATQVRDQRADLSALRRLRDE
jgi:superfamily II DNA or RNA helicase/nitroreductase